MRWPFLAIAIVGSICGLSATLALKPAREVGWRVVISGQFEGNLSPCGCTKPMSGGIRRLGTALAQSGANAVRLQLGPWIAGTTRQEVLKAEAAAKSAAAMEVDAFGLTLNEAKLGRGELAQLQRLSGNRIVGPAASATDLQPRRHVGSFDVLWMTDNENQWSRALGEPLPPQDQSIEATTPTAVLLDGDHAAAARLAAKTPQLELIVYRSESRPPQQVERLGNVVLRPLGSMGSSWLHLKKLAIASLRPPLNSGRNGRTIHWRRSSTNPIFHA